MKKVEKAQELSLAIAELELKAAIQRKEIHESLAVISEKLRPANLVKTGVQSVLSGNHKEELKNILMGMATGFISRKLFLRKSHGLVGKTLGNIVQWGMTGLVSKNAELIKQKAAEAIDWIFKKTKKGSNHLHQTKESNPRTVSE